MNGFDFSDAIVVVTGAGAGIGLGITQAFHAAGGRVALGDLRGDAAERAAAELGSEPTFAGVVDVRDEASMQIFFGAAERALGPVTIAVANAGIYPTCPVLDMTVEDWDRVMETNLRGVFLTCRSAARSMTSGARAGKIITIASGGYASDRLGGSHYCASKAGVVMFTKVLAMELAEQRIKGYIRVNNTPRPPDFDDALMKNIPWGTVRNAGRRRAGCDVPGLGGRGLRDGRGARRQRRGLCRAGVCAARHTAGAVRDGLVHHPGVTC